MHAYIKLKKKKKRKSGKRHNLTFFNMLPFLMVNVEPQYPAAEVSPISTRCYCCSVEIYNVNSLATSVTECELFLCQTFLHHQQPLPHP